jgi:hypothetical protein
MHAPERVLRAAQLGGVLTALAIGLLSLAAYFADNEDEGFLVVGVITLSIGIGFLVSAYVSHRIATNLGLYEPKREAASKSVAA